MAYNKNRDYQDEINKAVQSGDYYTASQLEKERNEKIDAEKLSYNKTNNYTVPLGVDGNTYNKMMASHNQSDDSKAKDQATNSAYTNLSSLTGVSSIVSNDTKKSMNTVFRIPTEVNEADAYLSEQLEKIQSGKTSYSDQVRDMMDKIMNRDKFSYDVDTDPLFQQALASATRSGKSAMQDTIGQASALTGGYGSTYATTAGNQAYNSYVEGAYDNIDEYYQLALQQYQMEGDEMYRHYGMLSEQDAQEYNRNLTAYDATSQYRNQLYNEEYARYRDYKNDAFNMANLELNEYGQLVNNAQVLYNAASNEADKMYAREYQSWLDSVNQATQYAQILNSNAVADREYDYQKEWNQKQFDENVRQYNESMAENKRQFDAQMAKASSGGGGGGGRSGGGGGGGTEPTTAMYEAALKAWSNNGAEGLQQYFDSLPSKYNREMLEDYVAKYGASENFILSKNLGMAVGKNATFVK